MNQLVNYLQENFGLSLELKPFNNIELGKLPLYLKNAYNLYWGAISNHNLIWANVIDDESWTPEQLKKQSLQFNEIYNSAVVFVFDKLEAWQRKRLIEKHVSFAQAYKQLYVPALLLELNDVFNTKRPLEKKSDKFTPPAQCAVLYHLQVSPIDHKPFKILADDLHYSTMTITRLVKELTDHKIISVDGSKEKRILFNEQGKQLWNRVLPKLSSPIKNVWFTDEPLTDKYFLVTYDTALDAYTMLSGDKRKSYAIGKDELRTLKKRGSIKKLDRKHGNARVEEWTYEPTLLAKDKLVDRLSLYLAMQNEEDERIQGALEELIKGVQW